MANVKISDLTAAAAASSTQQFEVNDSGTSKSVTGAQIAAFVETEVSSSPSFTGDVTIEDKIVHSGDTNTAIRFPAADTVTVETSGLERLRVDSSGFVGIGTDSPAYELDVQNTGDTYIHLKANSSGAGADDDAILIVDAAESGESVIQFRLDGVAKGYVEYFGTDQQLNIGTEAGSGAGIDFQPQDVLAMRINSSGALGVGSGASYGTSGQVLTSGGSGAAPSWATPAAPTSAQVGTATAGLSVGAVGSYAQLQQTTLSTSRSPGFTLAGSSLRYANCAGGAATAPSGTWMLFGQIGNSAGAANNTSVWLRIS